MTLTELADVLGSEMSMTKERWLKNARRRGARMKLLTRLRGRSPNIHRSAPNPGEPLLTCFDCHRVQTMRHLTLFPWWDERVDKFDVMYRCDRCLPKARKQALKQLAKNEEMLTSFVDFASQ